MATISVRLPRHLQECQVVHGKLHIGRGGHIAVQVVAAVAGAWSRDHGGGTGHATEDLAAGCLQVRTGFFDAAL